MIENITCGPDLQVAQGSHSYIGTTGVIRWNGSSQRLEVMDRDSWLPLYGSMATISVTDNFKHVMNWVMVKMAEEEQLKVLMDKHPGLKDTKEKFDIMLALVRNGEFSEHK